MDVATSELAQLGAAPTALQLLTAWAGGLGPAMLLLVIAGGVASIPVFLLLRWWSLGIIEAATLLPGLGIYLVVLAGVFGPSPVGLKAGLVVMLGAVAVGLPILQFALERSDVRALEQEQESAYRAAIAARPDNAAAYAGLAQLLHRQGRVSEAIEVMEQAVRLSPQLMEAEARLLEEWVKERESSPERPAICRQCRTEVPSDSDACPACGARLHEESLHLKELLSAGTKGLAVAVVGIMLSALVPSPLSGVVVLSAIAGGVFVAWRDTGRLR